VDALSSLLIVIIFVIIGFFLSQMHLSTVLNDTDASLKNVQKNFVDLQQMYAAKERELAVLLKKIYSLNECLNVSVVNESRLKVRTFSLSKQIDDLTIKVNMLNSLLESEKKSSSERENLLKTTFAAAVNEKVRELEKKTIELNNLKAQIPPTILRNPELLKYRSEFLAALQEFLGGHSDIRVVGDRFVFQAEVLFDQGSDQIGERGQHVLDSLVKILMELIERIPSQLNWVMRVDGHTDKVPIHNDKFDSNWDLSASRALSVVKYLIKKGIDPKRLAAAGFAEYYPLTEDPAKIAKNRRIEFKFDQQEVAGSQKQGDVSA
jgi:chemotaxis protein MotB